jgi:hypothetical protein
MEAVGEAAAALEEEEGEVVAARRSTRCSILCWSVALCVGGGSWS